jgi:hypothetical protein
MPSTSKPRPYPIVIRILLAFTAIFMIALTFRIMIALTQPSQYINAYATVKKGPGRTLDLQKMTVLNHNQHLYLNGVVLDAADEKSTRPMFPKGDDPKLSPSVFTDKVGAVEVLASIPPESPIELSSYHYNEPVHMLGWRRRDASFFIFAMAPTQAQLLDLMNQQSRNWKSTLFSRGCVLAILLFLAFWLLNIALLSNASLQLFQLLIVNIVFLVLFYSVLLLAAYPLAETFITTVKIVGLANIIFVPLSFLMKRKRNA